MNEGWKTGWVENECGVKNGKNGNGKNGNGKNGNGSEVKLLKTTGVVVVDE